MQATLSYRTVPLWDWARSFPSAQQAWRSYLRVIYVGGPWKGHDHLRLADTLIHTQFRYISLNLFVKMACNLQNLSMIFFNIA